MTSAPTRAYDPVSLSSEQFWRSTPPEQERSYRVLRDGRPVSWQPPPVNAMTAGGPEAGYWAVLRHADVVAVSRDTDTFCSGQGVAFDDIPMALQRRIASFLVMDDPEHARVRGAVRAAFTARRVARLEEFMRTQSRLIVDELIETGPCEFVEHVATKLPVLVGSEMLGVPESMRAELVAAGNAVAGRSDPKYFGDLDPAQALGQALAMQEQHAREMIDHRRRNETDDLLSGMIHAEIDGRKLTDDEIVATFAILQSAGNDTTRNATTIAVRALTEFPDQRAILAGDYETHAATAVEEFLRWSSPSITMRRTATRDVELAGAHIAEGDKVVLFYPSANHDERVFTDPLRLDVRRDPNPHVAFGGGGRHFCIGAILARAMLRSILRELMTRVPDLEAGEPDYGMVTTVRQVFSMPCTFTRHRGARR
jgi:cytochrome P450